VTVNTDREAQTKPGAGLDAAGVAEKAAPDRRWWALVAVCIALFAVCLNTMAINNALTAIGSELRISAAGLQWAINAYMLTCAAFVVPGGQLGDLFGRRKVFLVGGIGCFAAGSVLVALSRGEGLLIAGRAVQGLGSACILPGTMAIINGAFPKDERGTAMGVWGAVAGLGFALGPVVGGFFTDTLGWQWLWWMNLPLLAAGVALTCWAVPESREEAQKPRLDIPGVLLLGTGLFALMLGLNRGPHWGWDSGRVIGLLGVALALLAAFVVLELRLPNPLVHFRLFREPVLVASCAATFLMTYVLIVVLLMANLHLQNFLLLDYSAVQAGLALLPLNLALFVLSLFAGRVTGRLGVRWPLAGGFLLMAAGLYQLSRVQVHSDYGSLWLPFTVLGLGLGLTMGPSSGIGVAAVPAERVGEASGVINVSRYVAFAFGVTVGMLVFATASLAQLNTVLEKAGLGPAEERELDLLLAGMQSTGQETLKKVPEELQGTFQEGAREAAVAGFASTMRVAALAALLGAALSALLLGDKPHHSHHPAAPVLTHSHRPE
jgi:EmrB/QacA subfamily drug resistance transporter